MKILAIVLVSLLPCAQAMAQPERVATHLITSNEVVIAPPASSVWPHIVDPGAWKQGNKLVHKSGPKDATGEVFAAVSVATPDKADYYVENAEVVAGRKRVIKLFLPDGTLIGFAAFVLTESAGKTTVRYDVYSETRIPAAELAKTTRAALTERERGARESSMKRFDAELMALKKLVESK